MNDLALFGGTPVRSTLLPYARQTVDEDDIRAVVEVLRSPWLTTGPEVQEFEHAFAKQTGAAHAVAVSSGTAALHAAVFAARIGSGDEVIVPAMTFAATANCVRYVGGTVVFVDVRSDTLSIDPAKAAEAVSPRTRAIVAVDYAGQPADLDELKDLAERRGLVLIEDASHAAGAIYRGRRIGSVSPLTTFSFHPVKHVTTGEGGMLTTAEESVAARLRSFRNHGITTGHREREAHGSWWYEMVDLGYNYRLTDVQCALGRSQLRKLSEWLSRRHTIAVAYRQAMKELTELEPIDMLSDRTSAWHLYPVRVRLDRLRVGRAEVYRALRAENIGVNVHYIPVPWHPYYQGLGYVKGKWPVAEAAYKTLLSLPIFPSMSDQDVNDVLTACEKVLAAYRKG